MVGLMWRMGIVTGRRARMGGEVSLASQGIVRLFQSGPGDARGALPIDFDGRGVPAMLSLMLTTSLVLAGQGQEPSAARAQDSGADAGWRPLFNGRDLDGWYTFLQV